MVGDFLIENNLWFTSVFPKRSLKEDYLKRYRQRGNPESFVELVEQKWDIFVDSMQYDPSRCNHIELGEGEFLANVFWSILQHPDTIERREKL